MYVRDIEAYSIAFNLITYVWNIVMKWNSLSKNTVKSQIVYPMDSVSANISEGFGRYHKKDKILLIQPGIFTGMHGLESETKDTNVIF